MGRGGGKETPAFAECSRPLIILQPSQSTDLLLRIGTGHRRLSAKQVQVSERMLCPSVSQKCRQEPVAISEQEVV